MMRGLFFRFLARNMRKVVGSDAIERFSDEIFPNARDGYDLFDGVHVNPWSYWRGGPPPLSSTRVIIGSFVERCEYTGLERVQHYARYIQKSSSRLQLLRERESFVTRKIKSAEHVEQLARVLLARAECEHAQLIEQYGRAGRASLDCRCRGPKKRDLADAEHRACSAALGTKKKVEAAEDQLQLCVAQTDRFRRCAESARIGLEAGEWADAALSTIERAPERGYTRAIGDDGRWEVSEAGARWCTERDARGGQGPSSRGDGSAAMLRLLDEVDETGVPVGLAAVLSAVKLDKRAWKGPPHCSQWYTVDELSVVLALSAVNHAFRGAVRAWVDVAVAGLDFKAHRQPRDEFPRGADTHNGIHQCASRSPR